MHLVTSLVRADARAAPGRVVATAGLLAAAGLFGVAGTTGPLLTALLTGAVAGAAALGVVAGHRRRAEVLAGNGAGLALGTAVAAGSVLGPAVIAAVATLVVAGLVGAGPSVVGVLATTLVVPVLVAAVAGAVATAPSGAAAPRRSWPLPIGVVAAVVFPTIVLPALAVLAAWRAGRAGRVGAVLAALAFVVGLAFLAGSAGSFVELGLVLLVLGPPAVGAVALLGFAGLRTAAAAVGRLGSVGRLAAAPLVHQRSVLGPLVGIVAVVTSLAALDGTVGASFGQREAERQETRPTITAPIGTSDEQVYATLPRVDGDEVRRLAEEASAGTGTRAVVIDQVGAGGAPMDPAPESPGFLDFRFPPAVHVGPATGPAPVWLGVVRPEDLEPLGLSAYADDLTAGRAIVLNAAATSKPDEVAVWWSIGGSTLPATLADVPRVGVGLPAAVVSPEVAAMLGEPVAAGRLVVVPDDPSSAGVDDALAVASRVQAAAASLPVVPEIEDDPITAFASVVGADRVDDGGSQVVQQESGPLNEVPALARSAEQGRSRLITWGTLALLVTVAAVALALGATRADDAVLELQGARPRARAVIGAVQAAVITGSAALLAALVGVALPAFAFRVFNGHSQPEVPLVVPPAVPLLLLGLPLVAAVLSALLMAGRRDPQGGAAALADDLAW